MIPLRSILRIDRLMPGHLLLCAILVVVPVLFMMTEAWAGLNGFSGKASGLPAPDADVVAMLLSPKVDLEKQFPQPGVESLFTSVRNKIRYEPYQGSQRGANGTALVESGNSLDQSLLLFTLLKQRGYRVRLVAGELSKENTAILLRGLYPPKLPELAYGDGYAPYQIMKDSHYPDVVKTHYWVEINQGSSWLPLDPAFPRAKLGEAYAKPVTYFTVLPKELQQNITIRLIRKTAGKSATEIYEYTKPVSDLLSRPILLSCTGTAMIKSSKKDSRRGSAQHLFGGALSGKQSSIKAVEKKESDKNTAVQYAWKLYIPDEGVIENTYIVRSSDKKSFIEKEWLEFELHTPNLPVRHFERTLYRANNRSLAAQPKKYRRFNIGVFAGSVAEGQVKEILNRAQKLPLSTWQRIINSAARDTAHAEYAAVSATDASLNLAILHSALVRFATSSDAISDQAAYANGVALIRPVPRILIASVESSDGNRLKFNLDLRLDEVVAVPVPGAPAKLSRLYQLGRGISESVQEGKILQIMTGKPVVTTALLMKTAIDAAIPLKVVMLDNLSQSGLPDPVRELLEPDLKSGRNAIIPARAVRLSGVDRWGWWLIDPPSGRSTGMMDDQLNSAMTEYTLSTKEIGLNPKTGFVVGMVVGADTTLFSISAGMLKYGEVTPEMIKEIKQYLKSVTCASCPEAEAKLTAIEGTVGGDCLKKDISSSAKVSVDFCSKYADGFKCAAGLLLGGLIGDHATKAEIKVGGASMKVACEGK